MLCAAGVLIIVVLGTALLLSIIIISAGVVYLRRFTV